MPSYDERVYHYHFEDRWFRFANRYRVEFNLPFHTREYNTNGDSQGHRRVLRNPDFTIRDINVVSWARECVTRGKADLRFTVDAGDPFEMFPRPPIKYNLRARFSDKSIGMLFKLTFG